MSKYLDENGLLYFWQHLKTLLAGKVDTVSGKGLSTNDYTTSEQTKLSGIETGAEVNVIESILVNGTAATITSKAASITTPTKTSDLTNDSGYITINDVPPGSVASTTTPKMDGTASTGSENAFARGDHIHPTDTSRQAKITASGILKGDGSGGVTAATSGTDYAAASHTQALSTITGADDLQAIEALSGTSGLLKKTAANTWSLDTTSYVSDVSGLQTKITASGILKGNGSGGVSAATAGTDYAAASHTHTVSQISDFPDLTGVYKYKGSVSTYANLPSTGLTAGDVYNVEADGMNYAWTGTAWDALGMSFSIDSITNGEIDTIVAQ